MVAIPKLCEDSAPHPYCHPYELRQLIHQLEPGDIIVGASGRDWVVLDSARGKGGEYGLWVKHGMIMVYIWTYLVLDQPPFYWFELAHDNKLVGDAEPGKCGEFDIDAIKIKKAVRLADPLFAAARA